MNKRIIFIVVIILIAALGVFKYEWSGIFLFQFIAGSFAALFIIDLIRSVIKSWHAKKLTQREFGVKLTARFMVILLLIGTISYIYTFQWIGANYFDDKDAQIHPQFDNTELIIRSLMSSLDLFMLDIDGNTLDKLGAYPCLKNWLMVQAGLSFLCTIALLVSLVYSRAKAYVKLHKLTKITSSKNHLYIFFGVNENSRLLAKDINENDKNAVIVFVDEANLKDEENDSWNNIVNFFTHRQHTFEVAEGANARVEIASMSLCDIDKDSLKESRVDVLTLIEVDKVKKLIKTLTEHPDKAQLHVFFLSENEDSNIRSIINLVKDKTILDTIDCLKNKIKIYCHARYNGPNRVIEDLGVTTGVVVEIVDSSHLAVELLKSRGENQPVRVAALSKKHPVAVARPIESLIVGFAEVGRDAFRFLYEFGTFIDIADDGKIVEVKPHITAVDNKMELLEGLFKTNTPSINYDNAGIEFKNLDCQSLEFYNTCLNEERCRKLNYVMLALSDDDRNIALATNIFNRIRSFREDLSDLIIMVRCINDDKREMMEKTASHFNKGCGAKDLRVIRLFGNPQEIYSYDNLINNKLKNEGVKFMENYERLRKENNTWIKRRENLIGAGSGAADKNVNPNIDNLRKLRRSENQDLANALHSYTKLWLLRQALGPDYDWAGFVARLFDDKGSPVMESSVGKIYYPLLTKKENEVMLNLAVLEHARWNSAHELLGYKRNDDKAACDERQLRHNCLKPWEELDEESVKASTPTWVCNYKEYDFGVVNTTISLNSYTLGRLWDE